MSRFLRKMVDRVMGGRGESSITVPVMDGALKPNNYLDRMAALAVIDQPDNVVSCGSLAFFSSGSDVFRLEADNPCILLQRETAAVSFLAISPTGALAIGLESGGLHICGGPHDGKSIGVSGVDRINAPIAAVFQSEDTILVCNGSAHFSPSEWRHDLLSHGNSGAVFKIDLAKGETKAIARDLSWPAGICLVDDLTVLVSEAWKHRVLRLGNSTSTHYTALDDLPAYPGRLIRSSTGGYWLTLFAVRSQLQEFVLREPRFLREMMETIEPAYWIAPSLASGRSFKEPLQSGGVIRLGIHKPWAPTRSYGLVTRLDPEFQPVWSAHSRADGKRHGVTSIAEHNSGVLVTARGNDEVLAIAHTALDEPFDLHLSSEAVA